MFHRLRSLFSARDEDSVPRVTIQGQSGKTLFTFLVAETQACKLLNDSGKTATTAYFAELLQIREGNGTRDLKEMRVQSSEAKLAVLEVLPTLLSQEGLKFAHPGAIIGNIYSAATIKKARSDTLTKMRNNPGIKTFSLQGCKDARCVWCRDNMGIEHQVTSDVEADFDRNCVCSPYCKCYLKPNISL